MAVPKPALSPDLAIATEALLETSLDLTEEDAEMLARLYIHTARGELEKVLAPLIEALEAAGLAEG